MDGLQVTLDQTMPFTKARNTFSQLPKKLSKQEVIVITKQLKPSMVLVQPNYFAKQQKELKRLRRQVELDEIQKIMSQAFADYLKKKSLDPDKLSDQEVLDLIDQI